MPRQITAILLAVAMLLLIAVPTSAATDRRHTASDPAGDVEIVGDSAPDSFAARRSGYDVTKITADVIGTQLDVTMHLAGPWPDVSRSSAAILLIDAPRFEDATYGIFMSMRPGHDHDPTDCIWATFSGNTVTWHIEMTGDCDGLQTEHAYINLSLSESFEPGDWAEDEAPGDGDTGYGPFSTMAAADRPTPTGRTVDDRCDQHQDETFPDINGNVHEYAIRCVAGYGITEGRADGTYGPAAKLTKGQTATFLVRTLAAAGSALPDGEDPCDGSAGTHGESVATLINAGIATTVDCNASTAISRAAMATWVQAALEHGGVQGSTDTDWYSDDGGLAAEDAINAITSHGIVTGKGGGLYAPTETLTRAQMATFLARTLDTLLDG